MVGQVSGQLVASKLDRFGIQAGNASEGRDGGRMGIIGQGGDIPATLGLSHPTEQQVDVAMVASKLRVGADLAGLTLAGMHSWVGR